MEKSGSVRSNSDKESVHSSQSAESETSSKKTLTKKSSSAKIVEQPTEPVEDIKSLTKDDIRKGISQLARTADGLSHAYVRFELRDTDINNLQELSTYIHLRFVDVSRNQISSLKPFQPLEHILALIATDNRIKDVDIGTKNYLQVLKLERNKIQTLPELQAPLLRELNLNYNQIQKFQGIGKLDQLQKLELRGNLLKSAHGINCASLKCLYLAENVLANLEGFPELPNLEVLHLRKNNISSLVGLEKLTSLTYLNVRQNAITTTSDIATCKQLPNLQHLVLKANPIEKALELYRIEILITLPQIKRLDKENFEEEDHEEAKDLEEERKETAAEEARLKQEQLEKEKEEAAKKTEEENQEEGEEGAED